ncbi:Protein canopy-1 [Bagarius yarrelli]|uniref:Protein canopy-1 n=1 Tax=Bagarius yarrelli TaxID=175774 RepID=A0A556U6I4_BAGYA|nr:Protein canopy-1 [Bagarius yarrelli]
MVQWLGFMLLLMSFVSQTAEGKRDEVLYCSVCLAIVEELEYSISQIDPKKTIDVGGFRLNPDGSLTDKKTQVKSQCGHTVDAFHRSDQYKRKEKVPLARSESHLSELLDGVCNNMSEYALYEDPDTKQQSYRRFAPRSSDGGNFPNFQNFKFSGPEGSDSLKFACETIVEELEDDIIALFAQKDERVAQRLCSEVSANCKSDVFQHMEL